MQAARAEAAMAGVAAVAEERLGAWMGEAVMGVEAIGVVALVAVGME